MLFTLPRLILQNLTFISLRISICIMHKWNTESERARNIQTENLFYVFSHPLCLPQPTLLKPTSKMRLRIKTSLFYDDSSSEIMTVTSLELEGLVLDSPDWDFVGDSSDDVLPTRKEGKEKQPLVLACQRLYVWIIKKCFKACFGKSRLLSQRCIMVGKYFGKLKKEELM